MPSLCTIHYGDPIHHGGPSADFVHKMREIQDSYLERVDGIPVERHVFRGLGGRWRDLKTSQSYAEFNAILKRFRP